MSAPNIILFFGEDTYRMQQKVMQWKHAFAEKHGDFNLDEFDETVEIKNLIEAACSLPFLGEKRLVIAKNFLNSAKKDHLETLEKGLDKIPESGILLLWESTKAPDKRTKLFKTLKKVARIEVFDPLEGMALNQWVKEQFEKHQKTASNETIQHLLSFTGHNLWTLSNEIEKLCQYSESQTISKETIHTVVSAGSMEISIFKLTDALGNKQTKQALDLLSKIATNGDPIPMVFAMLARQIRMLLQIKALKSKGETAQSIASIIKQHPYAVRSMYAQVDNFSIEQLKQMHGKLVKIDTGLKTGQFKYLESAPEEYLLQIERWIVESSLVSK